MSGKATSGSGALSPLQEPEPRAGGGGRAEDAGRSGDDDRLTPPLPQEPARQADGGPLGGGRTEQQMREYRAQLARQMAARAARAPAVGSSKRPSPIEEEGSTPPPPATLSSGPSTATTASTASTGSEHTVRGGDTPAPTAKTPSYPFPSRSDPGARPVSAAQALHHALADSRADSRARPLGRSGHPGATTSTTRFYRIPQRLPPQ